MLASRLRKAFMHCDLGENHRQSAGQHFAAIDGFHQLWRVTLASDIGAISVGNTNTGRSNALSLYPARLTNA